MVKNNVDLESLNLITLAARLYYLEDSTQAEIADILSISRSKVNRLLKRAGEEGIVKITIHPHPLLISHMERELVKRFGLKQVLICSDHLNPDAQRAAVAAAAAGYLSQNLRAGMVISVGLGRNTAAIPEQISAHMRRELDCTFVPAMGGAPRNESYNPDYTCRRLAECFGGHSESFYAPAYVESAAVRSSLLSHETVRRTLELARRSTFALVGIGDVADDATAVRMGCFSAEEMAELRRLGAVGDIAGYYFDVSGTAIGNMQDRVVGLTIDELRRIPNVIGIFSERNKTLSVLGALRTGVIDILVTSASNVHNILAADSETRSEP